MRHVWLGAALSLTLVTQAWAGRPLSADDAAPFLGFETVRLKAYADMRVSYADAASAAAREAARYDTVTAEVRACRRTVYSPLFDDFFAKMDSLDDDIEKGRREVEAKRTGAEKVRKTQEQARRYFELDHKGKPRDEAYYSDIMNDPVVSGYKAYTRALGRLNETYGDYARDCRRVVPRRLVVSLLAEINPIALAANKLKEVVGLK